MKILLMTIPNGAVSYAFLRTDFFKKILENPEVRFILLVPAYRVTYYREEFKDFSQIEVVESISDAKYRLVEQCWNRFLRQSIPSRTIYNRQLHAWYGEGNFLNRCIVLAATRLSWFLGHLRFWRRLLRFIYRHTTPRRLYKNLLRKVKPDLVFVTTLYDPMDMGILKAACALGIPSAGMVKSWDSLTSKCFMAVHPDWLVVQNKIVLEEAVGFCDFPRKRILIGGIPQFDFYFKKDIVLPRELFLKKLGLSSQDRYILFAGEGLDIFPAECEVLQILDGLLSSESAFRDLRLLYRPHPNYEWCREAAKKCKRVSTEVVGKMIEETAGGWEFEQDDIQRLVNTIYHAEVVVIIASTIACEASIFDKSIIGIAFDGFTPEPYFQSVRRFYDTSHYEPVTRSGGMRLAGSREELVKHLKHYLLYPEDDREGRNKIVKEEVGFTDGKSAERIANFILSMLDKVVPTP